MWFSPGLLVGAILVLVIYLVTGTAAYWWLWLVALVLASIIDRWLGIVQTREVALKTRTIYVKEDPK